MADLAVVVENRDHAPEAHAHARAIYDSENEVTTATCDALRSLGFAVECIGVTGDDVVELLTQLVADPPDVVVNLCESLAFDARCEMALPCLLDVLGVPYTGSDALALGLALHKDKAKEVLQARGVPTPPFAVVETVGDLDHEAIAALDFPLIVKPAREDASLGVDGDSVVGDREALAWAVTRIIGGFRQPVLVERYVDGREISVAILGDAPLAAREIRFGELFAGRPRIVSMGAKWDPGTREFSATVPVACETEESVLDAACAAFAALGCRDYGRVDLRVTPDAAYVIDINPNCDLHPDAGYAQSAAAAGIGYDDLVGRLVQLARDRGDR